MAIQNFLPLNTLDKGEFVFARFDSVGDSVSYPIVQMPIITQSNWQNRVITSIICIPFYNNIPYTNTILSEATNLFRGYTLIANTALSAYTITLKTDKNIAIIDNWPLNLLVNQDTTGNDNIAIRQKKTDINVSLDNSFITRHSDAIPVNTSIVIPFYIQYK